MKIALSSLIVVLTAACATAIQIPITRVQELTTVHVMLNGTGPYTFAIDTGASGVGRVTPELATKLHLEPAGEARVRTIGTQTTTIPTVRVKSIAVGDYARNDVTVAVRPMPPDGSRPIDGILGFGFFEDKTFTLDYPAGRLVINDDALPAADGARVLTYELGRGGTPGIDIRVGDRTMRAAIDSGNTRSGFALPVEMAPELTFAAPPRILGRARIGAAEVEIQGGELRDTIAVGRYTFTNPTVVLHPFEPNIGATTLHGFAITFDTKQKRVRFEK